MECENNRPVEINIPEPLPDYNSENNIGSWRQLFAANMGKRVKIELSLFDGTMKSICGDIYLVGNNYIGLSYGDKLYFGDLFSIKFATFY